MELKIDAAHCERTGFCAEIAPSLFALPDGEGSVRAAAEVPAELEDLAREAAQMCPTQAIHVEEP